jgi:hypothetical protein
MKAFTALVAAAAAAVSAGAATSATAADTPALSAGREVAIPFVRSNGILEWRAAGDRAVYIRGGDGDWYLARTMNRCGRLTSAVSIGFETRGPDQLDRFGTLRVEGWRCPLASVTESEGPPPRKRR